MKKALGIALGVIVVLLVVAVLAVTIVTQTDWGRERVRRMALSVLEGSVNGIVRVGGISGNLINGATVHDLSITDSAGNPFLVARSASADYGLFDFLRKEIRLSDIRLVEPTIVLSKFNDEWNFSEIFPGDTSSAPDTTFGWGDLVVLEDVTITGGRLVVQTEWRPDDELPASQRDSALAAALAGEGRIAVTRTPRGPAEVMDFRSIDASLPLVRLVHPDHDAGRIEFASLAMRALAFNPPAAEIRDLAGVFQFTGDSLWWTDARARFPASTITGHGKYVFEGQDVVLDLHGEPVALADLRWLYPRLPSRGGGSLDFLMRRSNDTLAYYASNATLAVDDAQLGGKFGLIDADDTFHFDETDLRIAQFPTTLIEQLAPKLEIPVHGEIGGRLALHGSPAALRIDGDLTFDTPTSGRSHVIADGVIGFGDEQVRASNLRVTLDPFQVELAELVGPELPIDGRVIGTALVNGSTATRLIARADLTHEGTTGRSRLVGDAVVRLNGRPWLDVDLRAQPVALATLGRFTPTELRGSVSGPIRMRGPLDDLDVDVNLDVHQGGHIAIDGKLALAGDPIAYRLTSRMRLFNLNSVMPAAPPTSLSATAMAVGRGTDPATMRATLAANATVSQWDSIDVDTATVRVAIRDGLLIVDSTRLGAPSGEVEVRGTFGLVGGREGTIGFMVDIDSLSAFAKWLPADTGVVAPRPAVMAGAMRRAREDSARLAMATEVERAVTGAPAPTLVVDTPAVIRRDSVAGAVYAVGALQGNVERFTLRGRAAAEDLLVGGNSVNGLRAEYAWLNARTPDGTFVFAADADSLSLSGFYFDSAQVRVTYAAPEGTAEVLVRAPGRHMYSARVQYALHLDHTELHLDDVELRFDTTRWVSTQPGAIDWGTHGVEIEHVELRSGQIGRIYLDGSLPTEGAADLRIGIDNFEIGHLTRLLQTDVEANGLVSFTGELEGTTKEPRFAGAFGVVDGVYRGTRLPEVHGTARYADRRLETDITASRDGGAAFATAQGTIPVDLAFSGDVVERMTNGPLTMDIRIDSLPLNMIPPMTDALALRSGVIMGSIAVRGTLRDPAFTGAVAVNDGSIRLNPAGVTINALNGSMRMADERLVIDSLAGRSRGPIRVEGSIGLAELTKPEFDLRLQAANARILDNDRGELYVDATLALTGPIDRPHVAGSATVRQGVIYVPEPDDKEVISAEDPALFSVMDTAVVADRELLPEESPFLGNLVVDIDLTVDEGTWVRTPEGNIEVFGNIRAHIDQKSNEIVLVGFLNTHRGEYTFLSKRFEITRGSAIFIGSGELNPTLQVTGEYIVQLAGREPLTIRLLIGGTLQRPRLTVESDAQPPIPQSELLGYLAFGRSTSSLLQSEGSPLAGGGGAGGLGGFGALAARQLASVAMGVFVNSVEGEAAQQLGADVFNITPANLPGTLAIRQLDAFLKGTEVEVGKYIDLRTFVAVQARPQPVVPGIVLERRLGGGYRAEVSYQTRYFLGRPTLLQQELNTEGVFGLFFSRQWRFSTGPKRKEALPAPPQVEPKRPGVTAPPIPPAASPPIDDQGEGAG